MLNMKSVLSYSFCKSRSMQQSRNIVCLILLLGMLKQGTTSLRGCMHIPWSRTNPSLAANSTLGFGAIYAVSKSSSPRYYSLIQAANLTGLDITIPSQSAWQDDQVASIKAKQNSSLDKGSAFAWLGHLTALRAFLNSSAHTALIVEDDVDWDTLLRVEQIPRTSYAIRRLLDPQTNSTEYFGDIRKWDVLWLGHCGDSFDAAHGSTIEEIKAFHDPARLRLSNLHPWTRDFMREIGVTSDDQRMVHWSVKPLCSFAYAVTRHSAERLVYEIAVTEYLRDSRPRCVAYDVRLLEGCRDEGLRCITVNPELFHHSALDSEIARVSNNITNPAKTFTDENTANIRCSARSGRWEALRRGRFKDSGDPGMLARELAESREGCYIRSL